MIIIIFIQQKYVPLFGYFTFVRQVEAGIIPDVESKADVGR